MLAALALSFLAACSDDDDSDTITLDDCVAIDASVLSGTWKSNENILGYASVTLEFSGTNSFTAKVDLASTTNYLADTSNTSSGDEGGMTVDGTYSLTNGGKSIQVTTEASTNASASTLLFYVLGYSESESKLTLYVKTASTFPFSAVLGETLTFTKSGT